MKSSEPNLKPELVIIHQGFSKVTEGWHKAWVHDIQPYRDSWGDKMMIYFRLDGDNAVRNPLVWICPLIATPRNKTGRFLEAVGLCVQEGHLTLARELIGLSLWLRTTLITNNQIPFYKVTHFNRDTKGGDLFDVTNYPIGENSSTRLKAKLPPGPGPTSRLTGVNIQVGTHEPSPRPRTRPRIHPNRRAKPGYGTP